MNSIAFGGGCELAMACDFRLAAESATFGQPEINLGIIPGFGGTQRLPRLVGEAKALEMNLVGEPIGAYDALRVGLANQVVPDHELFDTALSWAQKLAGQAPLAVEQIKRVSATGDLDEGIEAEGSGFAAAFGSEDAKEGIGAFLGKRQAEVPGEVSRGASGAAQPRRLLARELESPWSSPARGSPCRRGFRTSARRAPGCGRTSIRWRSRTSTRGGGDPDRFWQFYGQRFASLVDKRPNRGPRGGGRAGARAAWCAG